MVSKASQLRAKGEKVSFETETGLIEYLIKPLKNKELLEVMELAEKNNSKAMLKLFLKYSLIKDDPSLTDADIEDMDASYLLELLKIISKVNKLEGMFDFQKGSQAQVNLSETGLPKSDIERLNEVKQKLAQNL